MGYRLADTNTTAGYNPTLRKLWFNRGKDRVFRERPWVMANANLAGVNGVLYSFDLTTLTRFYRLRGVSIPSSGGSKIIRNQRGINAFREIQIGGGPLVGIPSIYYVQNNTIYFNRIPASGTVITIDYWQIPADLALDVDTLSGLAATGWDDLFLGMACLCAASDIKGSKREFGLQLEQENVEFIYGRMRSDGRRMYGELDKWREFVREELDVEAESLHFSYSELGVIDGVGRSDIIIPGTDPVITGDDYW